jgi:RNA polymerase sigma-70 factor, ECF subfamily
MRAVSRDVEVRAVTRTGVSDEALMVRAQGDDVLAFAELYVRHADHALNLASEICTDPGAAEEVVQEGFLSIWRSRAGYRRGLGTFEAWSMRIVHNRAVDSVRQAGGRPSLQPSDPHSPSGGEDEEDPPFDRAVERSERALLFDALRRLPVRQTEVIVLAYYGDLSLSEIAAKLGAPPGTVKGRMRLALEKLRGEWPARERRESRH